MATYPYFPIRYFPVQTDTTAPSASEIADAVWDELLSVHTNSGSAGERLGKVFKFVKFLVGNT